MEHMEIDAFLSGSDMVSEASDAPIVKADDMPGMPKTPRIKRKTW